MMNDSTDFDIDTDFTASELPVRVMLADNSVLHGADERELWRGMQEQINQLVKAYLPEFGGILFRGFQPYGNEQSCKEFAQIFEQRLLSYEFGSTPRTDLGDGIYTATEYPAHQIIPLHNEQSYTLHWPMKIWFHCVTKADTGGETPIADSRKIYRRIPESIRRRFEEKRLMYVRNYGNGLDLPWEQVFNTDSKSEVESFCHRNHIEIEWKYDDELRTRQVCQATMQHPISRDWVWFNQAHLFHVSNLEPTVREDLLEILEIEDLPRNVFYGDGTEIEDSILEEIRGILTEESVSFSWQEGDFLMLDNMLVAHGRSMYTGNRKIVVAMAEEFRAIE